MDVSSAPVGPKPKSRWAGLAGYIFPLFFVICFPLAYVSAVHSPAPHEMAITIVGPDAAVGELAAGLDEREEFTVAQTDVVARAESDVKDRASQGSLLISFEQPATDAGASGADDAATGAAVDGGASASGAQATSTVPTVTLYYAGGNGRAVTAALQSLGATVAEQFGTTLEQVDVSPLWVHDSQGTSLFFLVTYSTLGGYLLIVMLTQMFPKAKLRARFGAVTAASVAIPLFVFGLSAVFVGDFGASFGTIAAMLGINALYVFTIGSLAILIQSLFGRASVIVLMGFVVMLNFPSSGGPMPAAMLPPFWQHLHGFYFGSAAMEAFRGLIYFDGTGNARWVLQLLAWAVAVPLLIGIVELIKRNTALRTQLADPDQRRADTPAGTAPTGHTATPSVEGSPSPTRRGLSAEPDSDDTATKENAHVTA